MAEKAIAVPFDSGEIVEIAVMEFRKRLLTLCPLNGNKEYAGFDIHFNHTIKLYRMGSNGGGEKDTLAWGDAKGGNTTGIPASDTVLEVKAGEEFKSGNSPNDVRLAHDLPLTTEVGDGKGGKIRRKVRIKE